MSTWHQNRNPAALAALWAPHPTQWKCVSDRFDRPAGSMSFETEAEAKAYAERTGDIVIPPRPQEKQRD